MRWSYRGVLLCVGVLFGSACVRSAGEPRHASMMGSGHGAEPHCHGGCDHLPRRTIDIDDVEDGVSLRYRAGDGASVADVRADVALLAERINGGEQAFAHCPMHAGMHGAELPNVQARARVEELVDGARLLLAPRDASQLQALRAQAREHAPCPHCARHGAQASRGDLP